MTICLSGTVADSPEPTTLEGTAGYLLWLVDSDPDQTHVEAARVFLPDAVLPDAAVLRPGSWLTLKGRRLPTGTMYVEASWVRPDSPFRPVAVTLTTPDLSRLRPSRTRNYRLFMWVWLTTFLGISVIGEITHTSSLGVAGFLLMLAGGVWLVVRDLRTRAIDTREYAAFVAEATAAIEQQIGVEIPAPVLLTLLGAGVERTGNPWNPTRPRAPRHGLWWPTDQGDFLVELAPIPLQPGQPVTFTVRRITPQDR